MDAGFQSGSKFCQFADDLNHSHRVETAVFVQLLPHAPVFLIINFSECHTQKFPAGRTAFLNRQIFIALGHGVNSWNACRLVGNRLGAETS